MFLAHLNTNGNNTTLESNIEIKAVFRLELNSR